MARHSCHRVLERHLRVACSNARATAWRDDSSSALCAPDMQDPADGWLAYAVGTLPSATRITFIEGYWKVGANPPRSSSFYSPWFGMGESLCVVAGSDNSASCAQDAARLLGADAAAMRRSSRVGVASVRPALGV